MAGFRTYVTLLLFIPVSASKDPEKKTVKHGHNVTLQCHGHRNANIIILEWSRPDQADRYVFYYTDGHFRDEDQHESFRGRVQLQDPQMKDGNVSLILKNVNINDTGTYTCRVSVSSKPPELINTINLTVTGSGETSGNTQTGGEKEEGKKDRNLGLKVGLSVTVGVLLLVAVVGFVIYKRHKGRSDQPI